MKPDKLTIIQLFSELTVVQIWAIVGALVSICYAGYLAGSLVGDAKVSEKESQIAALQLRVDKLLIDDALLRKQIEDAESELKNMNFKELFMSLYLNYIKEADIRKRAHVPPNPENENTSKVSESRDYLSKFAKFIDKLIESKEITLKKGSPGNESIVLFKDGTQWNVPSEVMERTVSPSPSRIYLQNEYRRNLKNMIDTLK